MNIRTYKNGSAIITTSQRPVVSILMAVRLVGLLFWVLLAKAAPTANDIETLLSRGDLAAARTAIEHVIQEKPTSGKAYYVYAQILHAQRQDAQARQALTKAEELSPAMEFAKPEYLRQLKVELQIPSGYGRPEYGGGPPYSHKGRLQASFEGLGPVKFGMTVQQASSALGIQLKENPKNSEATVDYVGCHYASNKGKLKDVEFMISHGRIVRIDISDPNIATVQGARIGMAEKEIRRIYPNMKSEPNKYEETWHDLKVSRKEQNGSTGIIIFQSNGKRVVGYRVGNSEYGEGGLPAVELVEHCL